MKIRLFSGKLLLPLVAFSLLAVSDLSSPSKAEDGFWLARSQSGLEQLWSNMLGCTDTPPLIRDRLGEDRESSVSAKTSSDYSQCGKRALRNTSSRILVDTIEDVVRAGGVALFSEHFRLDSSIGWVLDESATGEIDAVIPLFSRERSDGTGQALFLQPGAVFWSGLESEDRIDANLGLVYRLHLRPGVVAGGSIFYDYDLKREHQRLGLGADVQSGSLQAALNYYHPLNDWQEGRTDYEEQPLQGGDFRLGFVRSRLRLDTSIGVWRFEGEEEENAKWRPSFDVGAGYWIYPGVAVEGGYEKHDSDSLDSRWNAGIVFRFSLPSLQGFKNYETAAQANLWEPVRREKRILYEEREAIPPVRLSPASAVDENGESVDPRLPLAQPAGDGSMTTVVIAGELEAALPTDVMFQLVVEDSTAEAGVDYNYGHKVYELDAATGEQTAPAGDAIDCGSAAMCEMPIPAGVTRFDIEVDILKDADPKERREDIVVRVDPPEEHQRMIRGGETRLTIEAHGNEIGFATDAVATLAENNERTGVEVQVSIDEPSPAPITLNVATSGTATVNEDYRIGTTTLIIPANASSASLTLRGINNDEGEGSKSIVLTLSGNLPEGWTITDDEHTVTLQDDDLSIFFVTSGTGAIPSSVEEPASDQSVMFNVGITQAPVADITVNVAVDTSASTAQASDYTFTTTPLTFSMGSTTPQTATLTINHDMDPEGDETVVLTIADDSTNSRDVEGSGFSLGANHTITIPANDNTVGFASNAVATLNENGGTANVEVSIDNPAPVDITLNVSATDNAATVMIGRDYRISTRNLTIPRGQTTGTITLTGINNERGEGSKDIDLTLSVVGNLPNGWAEGDLEHKVTLQDDDLSISFVTSGANATPNRVEEPGSGNTPVTVTVGITQAPMAEIKVMVEAGGTGQTVQAADYTFTATELTFPMNSAAAQTATLMVLQDNAAEADDETIVLTLSEVSGLTTGGNNFSLGGSHTITIPKNGNTVGFASGTADTLGEDGGTANVEVSIDKPAPADITLNVSVDLATSTATEGTDFTLSPSTLTISQGQMTGTITLTGINNQSGDGNKDIGLVLSVVGNLPDGWAEGDLEHKVTLQDDDLIVYFVTGDGATPNSEEEPASDQSVTIEVGITQAPSAEIKVMLAADTSASSAERGTGKDYTFTDIELTFPAGGTASQTATLMLLHDTVPENDETIVLTLTEVGGSLTAGGNNFSLGGNHTITIPANDQININFATGSSRAEGAANEGHPTINLSRSFSSDLVVNVAVSDDSTAVAGEDYTDNIPSSVTILAGNTGWFIEIDVLDDDKDEDTETIIIEISIPSAGWPEGINLGQKRHVFSILDNDVPANTIGFRSGNTVAVEGIGAFNQRSAAFTLEIAKDLPSTVDITVTVSGVSDASGFTFFNLVPMVGPTQLSSNVLSIGSGVTEYDFIMGIPEDDNTTDENITLTLSSSNLPSGWSFGSTRSPSTWMLTVEDND